MTTLREIVKIAWDAEHHGDLESAVYWYKEAVNFCNGNGDTDGELMYMSNLAEIQSRIGQLQEAVETATRLLVSARKNRLEIYEMRASGRLAEVLLLIDPRGRWEEVKPLLQSGLKTAKQTETTYWQIYFLTLMAQGYIHSKNFNDAYACLQEATIHLSPTVDDPKHLQSRVFWLLALLMLEVYNYSEARTYAEQAIGVAKEDGVLDFVAKAQLILAQVELAQEQFVEAFGIVESVNIQAKSFRWKLVEQTAEYLRGELARRLNYLDIAEAASSRSLFLAREMKTVENEVKSLLGLGQVMLVLHRREEASDLIMQAQKLSQEQNYGDHLAKTIELLD